MITFTTRRLPMRITAEAKEATRARILEVAKALFRDRGFDAATIRDIAQEANLAVGTLFNYFVSKEEVAVVLAAEAVDKARQDSLAKRLDGATLSEDLFLHVAAQLRRLKPLRKFIQSVLDAGLASAGPRDGTEAAWQLRAAQLEDVAEILRTHGADDSRWSMAAPIYWALYIGVLSSWGRDKSSKQEDTLAMLDQATQMFAAWLEADK
jgi:AcrR family transcriptional regulator